MTAPNAAPVVEARALSRHYLVGRGLFRAPATVRAVEDVSFTLAAGRTLAVVGESGCGKSTLARIVALLDRPTSGVLAVDGKDATSEGRAVPPELRRSVQMVFQNPYGSLNPRKTVGAILGEPLVVNTALDAQARTAAAHAMLQKVGLRPEHHGRYPHMFSGGQRQRIAIARALMLNPRVLVADGRDSDAIPHYREVIRLRPDFVGSYLALADLFSKLKINDEAISALEEGLARLPNDQSLRKRYRELAGKDYVPRPTTAVPPSGGTPAEQPETAQPPDSRGENAADAIPAKAK